ncbi:MAG: hypothetical protein ACC645_15615, partial [Pirellulales bacterium]
QVSPDGAGFRAGSIDLVRGTRDDWFRPIDVAVAPDGSLLITDWYDPGVGGHNQGDLKRGRIFRLAPTGCRYGVPTFDFESAEGAVEALRNPAYSVRYLAWTSLRAMGGQARAALETLLASKNARYRARALWLLARIDGQEKEAVDRALADQDEQVRVMGLRLARQLEADPLPRAIQMAHDRSAQVRRQAILVLRGHKSAAKAKLWAELALQHDGRDRWYLESLGIAADGDWDACFEAWLSRVGDRWESPAGTDIVWRSRSQVTPGYLARLVLAGNDRQTVARYLRAFDFLEGDARDAALEKMALAHYDNRPLGTWIASEAMLRMAHVESRDDPRWLHALQQVLDGSRGTQRFVDLVVRHQVTGRDAELLALAKDHADEQLGIDAMRAMLDQERDQVVANVLRESDVENLPQNHAGTVPRPGDAATNRDSKSRSQDQETPSPNPSPASGGGEFGTSSKNLAQDLPIERRFSENLRTEPDYVTASKIELKRSVAIARVLGHVGNRRSIALLETVIDDKSIDLAVRREAARSLTRSREGGETIVRRVRAKQFDLSLTDAVAVGLATSPIPALRRDGATLFPTRADRENRPLPTIPELLDHKGDVVAGRRVFLTTGTCATCHLVGDEGKEVGPPLTEIGSKFGRQALFESILYPNAGINHNYETYAILLEDGRMLSGLLVSQTPELVTIKVADAVLHKLPRAEIEAMEKQQVSLMPSDLQKVLSVDDLVNVVEYLTTLKAGS